MFGEVGSIIGPSAKWARSISHASKTAERSSSLGMDCFFRGAILVLATTNFFTMPFVVSINR